MMVVRWRPGFASASAVRRLLNTSSKSLSKRVHAADVLKEVLRGFFLKEGSRGSYNPLEEYDPLKEILRPETGFTWLL